MDFLDEAMDAVSMTCLILLLLFNTHAALDVNIAEEEENDIVWPGVLDNIQRPCVDDASVNRVVLNHFRLWTNMLAFDEQLGFWVKPRSTTWFSKFLLEEYDDQRWVQMFRMTKRSVLSLAELLAPLIRRRDTNYRLSVPVTIRLACTLFKLSHGASLLICSELFAVGRSTVSLMLRDVVHVVNIGLRNEIQWPAGDELSEIAGEFEQVCGLPGVLGAIDATHFAIAKPRSCPADYYYFKTGGFSMTCQAVVDSSKRFVDINVGMPGSVNDSRVLRRSTLFHRGQHGTLWNAAVTFRGFTPYLLGDGGYPLLPWLMTPHRHIGNLPVAARLFNRKLSKGRAVVENSFALLKQTFRELHQKCELNVTFLPDVVFCCAILHNILIKQTHEQVEQLLEVLQAEAAAGDFHAALGAVPPEDAGQGQEEHGDEGVGLRKRQELAVFLALSRAVAAP